MEMTWTDFRSEYDRLKGLVDADFRSMQIGECEKKWTDPESSPIFSAFQNDPLASVKPGNQIVFAGLLLDYVRLSAEMLRFICRHRE